MAMAPVNVRLNPIGVAVFIIGLILAPIYLFGMPDFFRGEERVSMKDLLAVSIGLAERGGYQVKDVFNAHKLDEKVKGKTAEGAKEMLTTGDLESHRAIYYGFSKMYPGIKVISEEHETKPVDLNKILPVPTKVAEVEDVIKSDQSIRISDITIWVDPLDATQEYTEGLTQYVTTMVCVVVKGEPKIGVINRPFQDETVWAWDGYGHSRNLEQGNVEETRNHKIIVSRSHPGDVTKVAQNAFGKEVEVIFAAGAGYKALEVIKGSAHAYTHVTLIKKWDICAGNAILNAVGGKMTTLDGDFITYKPYMSPKNNRGLLATSKKNVHYMYLEKLAPTVAEKKE